MSTRRQYRRRGAGVGNPAVTLNGAQWATVLSELHYAAAHHAAEDIGGSRHTSGRLDTPHWRIKRIEFVKARIEKQLREQKAPEERGRA